MMISDGDQDEDIIDIADAGVEDEEKKMKITTNQTGHALCPRHV